MQFVAKMLKKPVVSTILSIIFGFLVASIILLFSQYSPFDVTRAIFEGVFSSPKHIANVITKSTSLILTGLSVAFAFKLGLFNIGAEGQFIVGSIAAATLGINLNLPPILAISVLILAGILAGGIWSAIVGYLKAKFGIHEAITSIMLNWIALYLSNFAVNMPVFKKPNSSGTHPISTSGFTNLLYNWKTSPGGVSFLKEHPILNEILIKTDINSGIIISVILAGFISFLLYKTRKGYELRAVGQNPSAAEFAGIKTNRNIFYTMLISGGIAGLAGALKIMGEAPHCISQLASFEGNGLNGLAVALIAGSSPLGCVLSGLFFGGLIYSARNVQSQVGAPSEIINIIIGIIVFFISLARIFPQMAQKLSALSKSKQRRSSEPIAQTVP
jgi:simple sugar transport system permease protein